MGMSIEIPHSKTGGATNLGNSLCTMEDFVLKLFSSVLMKMTPSLKATVDPAVSHSDRNILPRYVPGSFKVVLGENFFH